MDVIKIILALLLFSPLLTFAQKENSKYNIGEVEIDILNSYYQQDGEHSAVEGGIGTQELTDFVNTIKINIPYDSVNTISLDASYDTYTSASTAMIDWTVSGPSHSDERTYANLHYSRIIKNDQTISLGGGFSSEWDVLSLSTSAGWQKAFNNENNILGFDVNYLHDNWSLIYPTELRASFKSGNGLETDIRQTLGLNTSYSFVINRKMQAQLVYNLTAQFGLLSTPFHRVFFATDTTGWNFELDRIKRLPDNLVDRDIERLPNEKFKHAFAVRTSNYISSWLVVRSFYRYYFDSFGINAHTVSLEFPIKPTRFISMYPFYRFHTQTAASYFAPFFEHTTDETYYTSDYDLSAFSSHKYGVGIKYSPALGIISLKEFPFQQRTSTFKSIELRVGKYSRSDGLSSFIISSGLSFSF